MKRKILPLLVATTNAGKAREIAAALGDSRIRILTLAGLQIAAEYPEMGSTFAANARGKAVFYSRRSGRLTLAEDSGLAVDVLAGAPGVLSARYSGPRASDEKNNRKLLLRLRGVPPEKRGARFVCCMVLAYRRRVIKQVTGSVRGLILAAGRGESGFGYDPLFFYYPLGRSFGELRPEIKNCVSHRGRALRKMAAYLEANLRFFDFRE